MILVTGATGFTGSHFIKKLARTDAEIRCFVRKSSDISELDPKRIEIVYGSFEDTDSYRRALSGVEILVNIASLGFGHAGTIVDEAVRAGVQRAVFISTTAIFTTLPAQTKAIRTDAEKKVMSSPLDYTIIRPTMIYGTERDRNMARLVRTLRRYPIFPVPGNGNSLQQPIYVDDLAEVILNCIDRKETYRRAYNVSGKEPLTFNEVIDTTAFLLGKKVKKIYIPLQLTLPLVRTYNRLVKNPKIKTEQILRLNEDKAFDHSDAVRDIGFSPRTFREGIALEIERMKRLGFI